MATKTTNPLTEIVETSGVTFEEYPAVGTEVAGVMNWRELKVYKPPTVFDSLPCVVSGATGESVNATVGRRLWNTPLKDLLPEEREFIGRIEREQHNAEGIRLVPKRTLLFREFERQRRRDQFLGVALWALGLGTVLGVVAFLMYCSVNGR